MTIQETYEKMRKLIAILFVFVMSFTVCACDNTNNSTTETTQPPTAYELLSTDEQQLFNMLIDITTDDFYSPQSIRILKIGDERHNEDDGGPRTIVLKLQGQNRAGGVLSHCYRFALSSGEDSSDVGQIMINIYSYNIIEGDRAKLLEYKATKGDYGELSDSYEISSETDSYSIMRLNNALVEYWRKMGFIS